MSGRVIPFLRRGEGGQQRHKLAREDHATAEPEVEEVACVGDRAEALVLQGLLEAHGIRVHLRTHVAHSVHPFTVGAQGAVRVLVPREAGALSRRLLARARRASPPRS